MPDSLNDLVVLWGIDSGSLYSYDPAKYALTEPYTQDEVAVYGGADNWNDGIMLLAQALIVYSSMLMETGDELLMETGDVLLLEQ